jgi:hypothetical protein
MSVRQGIFGRLAFWACRRFRLRSCEESGSSLIVSANGGITVFDGLEIEILRHLARHENDRTIAERIGVHPYFIADVRAKLRDELGITTATQLAELGRDFAPTPR